MTANTSKLFQEKLPAGKMKLEFLENPSSTLLGYSTISNLIQPPFWDFLEIACWYWPDLAIIQANKLGLRRISLNLKNDGQYQQVISRKVQEELGVFFLQVITVVYP